MLIKDLIPKEDYYTLFDKLYEEKYGECLTEEYAKELVKAMLPSGERFSLNECSTVECDCTVASKYFVMNMAYNDFYEVFHDDVSQYKKFAKLWLNDQDSVDGDTKAYRYTKVGRK